MTTRTRWTLAAILNVVVIATLWAITALPAAAKQAQPSTPRLTFTVVKASSSWGTNEFIKDNKTGACWLAVTRGEALSLASAPPGACE